MTRPASTLRTCIAAALSAGALAATTSHAAVIYVDDDIAGGDGLSWLSAYADLQDALAAAVSGDEIWVAAGTYTPSDTDATASFVMAPGVALYGGFGGTETSRGQRDWQANETILSGDIGRDDITDFWPNGWNIVTSNAGHVIDASGATRDTVIDGFTIANGNTGPSGTIAGDPLHYGGGIYIVGGSPTVRNCTLTHNLAAFGHGGGVYCFDGAPIFEGCVFFQNYAHGGGGAGMLVYGNSAPEFRGCEFLNNIAVSISASNLDGDGAGLALYCDNWITVEDCLFSGNTSKSFYTVGTSLGYGGGLWVWNGGVTVDRCVFSGNTANYGGGMICWGPGTVTNSLFTYNTALAHDTSAGTTAGGDGAAVAVYAFAPDELDVINCTIANNTGAEYAGAVGIWNARINLMNSIIRGNHSTNLEFANTWLEQVSGFNNVESCNIAHIFEPHAPGEDPLDPQNLPGCIDTDPLWVAPGIGGDFSLSPGSPSIDAGDNSLVPLGVATDLAGNPRFMDDPMTPDTGAGAAPIADMGAYEFGEPVIACPTDLNNDGVIDTADLGVLLGAFGSAGPLGDLNGDSVVDTADLGILLGDFGGACPG
ncbi:MAG: right-handed parallel beta-helix repeat-containing protein [Phycisphaeraceae bacterium]|nr:right-handed parallel beta-helix repeat-containing protein [Phycisphaeraceae bacterium]MCB9848686.1 right-handed parallel beta-helix repeat-containing protein [Phycisphaeraceae bacterium]